jgi:hypothetical protein
VPKFEALKKLQKQKDSGAKTSSCELRVGFFCRNNTAELQVKKNPTNLVGYDILPLRRKICGRAATRACMRNQITAKAGTNGDVAEWLKATVC